MPTRQAASAEVPDAQCVDTDKTGACIFDASLVQLIARPELFEGKRVRVLGYASLGDEDNGLYLSRMDWENGIRKNGLWLDDPPATAEGAKTRRWNKRYVLVEGTFTTRQKGHLGMWSGSISNIQRYIPWRGEDARPDENRPD